ncbi:MAG: sigma-E processing peptidase SpoIIGA [Lachnospiraceae bacterium]|nr:sigma-E processing peptidase SpoIIGA [Lachnospiraceae bacterium]
MTIYLDVVFFMNLLYQLGILFLTDRLLHCHAKMWRLLLGGTVGSLSFCLGLLAGIPVTKTGWNFLFAVLIGIISIVAAFCPQNKRKLPAILIMELFLSICLAGMLQISSQITGKSFVALTAAGSLLFLSLFCLSCKQLLLAGMRREKDIYDVVLFHKGRQVEGKGLLDTGNSLYDPISKEPVVILQKSMAKQLLLDEMPQEQKGYRIIPYQSIGTTKGVLEAFFVEKVILSVGKNGPEKGEIERTQVLCAVYEEDYSKNGGYEIILHPLLL